MRTKYIVLLFFVVGTLLSMDNPVEESSSGNHKRGSSLVRVSSAFLEKLKRSPRNKKGSQVNGTQEQDDESPGSPKKKKVKPKVKQVENAKKKKRPDSTDEHKLVVGLIGNNLPEYNKLLSNPKLIKILCEGQLHDLKHSKDQEDKEKYAKLVEAGKKSSSSDGSSGSSTHSESGEDN